MHNINLIKTFIIYQLWQTWTQIVDAQPTICM